MECKYRAWDKIVQCMMDVGEIHFCHAGIKVYGTGVKIGNGWVTEANGCKHDCDVILLQYTGLKDKNGEEIYEGDVVRHETDFNLDVHGPHVVYEVIYRSGMWCASYITSATKRVFPRGYNCGGVEQFLATDSKDIYFSDLPDTKLEIIGNIYANPELLEANEKTKAVEGYPAWICFDCAMANGGKAHSGVSTFHTGECGWCLRKIPVTETRDYRYPTWPNAKENANDNA